MLIERKELKKYGKMLLLAAVGFVGLVLLLLYVIWFTTNQEEECGKTNFISSNKPGTNPGDPICSTVDGSNPYQR